MLLRVELGFAGLGEFGSHGEQNRPWILYLTIGAHVDEVPQCHYVRCYTVSVVELLFDGFGMMFRNPLTLWAKFSDAVTVLFHTRLSIILKLIGGFFLLVLLHVVAYFAGMIADVTGYLSQLVSIIVNMPVIALLTRMMSAIWTFWSTQRRKRSAD